MIGSKYREAIDLIIKSDDWSFDELLRLSGLDPANDFRFTDLRGLDLRGCDLRGFDFTGADLSDCLIDDSTMIDETTILSASSLRWSSRQIPKIHEKMLAIHPLKSPEHLRREIEGLLNDYNSKAHIRSFLKDLLKRHDTLITFIDIADFYEVLNSDDKRLFTGSLRKIALKASKKGGYGSSQILSPSKFIDFIGRLKSSENDLIKTIYMKYLEESEREGRITLTSGKYEVTDDLKRLMSVLDDIEKSSYRVSYPSSTPR